MEQAVFKVLDKYGKESRCPNTKDIYGSSQASGGWIYFSGETRLSNCCCFFLGGGGGGGGGLLLLFFSPFRKGINHIYAKYSNTSTPYPTCSRI